MAGQCIILMGVSGTGKSTVGQALAHALGAKFIDGDDLHPRNNIVKMATSQPLNDEDRQPWLTRIADVIFSLEQKNESGVLVCSALKKRYRDRLREGNAKLRFLWLTGDYDCILQRMRQRKGHFMPEALLRCSGRRYYPRRRQYCRSLINVTSFATTAEDPGMIIDTLTAAAENELYPPVIRQALQAVLQQQPHALPPGKYTVESDNVFFTVVEGHTRPLSEQRPEYHRQYLDIHIVLKGEEIIGAGNKGLPVVEDGHFNTTQDIGFCQAIDSETLIHLYPEELAILFPGELHRPMACLEQGAALRKIVVKIDRALL